jgi:hypothetical protein
MLGNIDEAKANVESAKQAAERNPGNAGINNGYLGMRARLILETGNWERIALQAPEAPKASQAPDHASMPGMSMPTSNTWIFIAGYSAAKLGDLPTAERAVAMLRGIREKTEGGSNPVRGRSIAILEKQVAALVANARGQRDEALKLAKGGHGHRAGAVGRRPAARSDQAGPRVLRRIAAGGGAYRRCHCRARIVAATHAEPHALGEGLGAGEGGGHRNALIYV